jgi:hypothetical protein
VVSVVGYVFFYTNLEHTDIHETTKARRVLQCEPVQVRRSAVGPELPNA